jgi:glucose-6-phosphate 1-dehydrogenase
MTSRQEPRTAAEARDTDTAALPTLVVLGAAGDLTGRLLLPGLAVLINRRKVNVSLIGSDRADWDDDQWRDRVQQAFASQVEATPGLAQVVRTTRYARADVTDPNDLDRLLRSCSGPVILYFALPPAVTQHACRALTELTAPPDTRLVMEKPFGSDAASAGKLNQVLTASCRRTRFFA